jgi:adenylyl-sulfate kinase
VWFTGLSGSGKTTVARVVDRLLFDAGRRSFLLDGDALRTGLNEDLGFSPDDREANLRRFAEVSRLFAEAGMLCLVSAITPYEATRDRARERVGAERFILVHVATPLEVCEARDAKGLYRPRLLGRARSRSSPASSPPARSPATPTSCCVPRTGIRRRWAGE